MTNIQYKVDDMTAAPMDVKQWVDTEVSEELYKCYFYFSVAALLITSLQLMYSHPAFV